MDGRDVSSCGHIKPVSCHRFFRKGHIYMVLEALSNQGRELLALTLAPLATLCPLVFSVFGKVDALRPALIGPRLCCVWLGGKWKSLGFSMVFLCNMVFFKCVKQTVRVGRIYNARAEYNNRHGFVFLLNGCMGDHGFVFLREPNIIIGMALSFC